MRSIITFSVPESEKVLITKRAKKAGITVSMYLLHAVQIEQKMIGENEIVKMAHEVEKDYKSGRTKKLKSLSDLML